MLTAQAPSGWDPMILLQWIGSDVLNQINCDFVVGSRVLIGSGTELYLCIKAAASLRGEGRQVRVVSMPCIELFEEQDSAYRESVLPAAVRRRVVVEASSSFGRHKYTGFDGAFVSIDRFGAAAPGPLCMEKFGFTVENVVAQAKALA